MSPFDRVSKDTWVRQIQSVIFHYTHCATGGLDQAYVDSQVHRLRSAYMAAGFRAAARGLRHVIRDLLVRRDERGSAGSTPQPGCAGHR